MDGRNPGGPLEHHGRGHHRGLPVAYLVDGDEVHVVAGGDAPEFFLVFPDDLLGAFNGQLDLHEIVQFHLYLVGDFQVFLQRRPGLHDRGLGGGFARIDRADDQGDALVGRNAFQGLQLGLVVAEGGDIGDVLHIAQPDGQAAFVGDLGITVGYPAQPLLPLVVEVETPVLGHVAIAERLVHINVPDGSDDLDPLALVEGLADRQPAVDTLVHGCFVVLDFQVDVRSVIVDSLGQQFINLVGAFPGLLLQGQFLVPVDEGFKYRARSLADNGFLVMYFPDEIDQLIQGKRFMLVEVAAVDAVQLRILGDKARAGAVYLPGFREDIGVGG